MDLLRWRRSPRGDQPPSVTAFETDVCLEPLRTIDGWPPLLARVQARRGRVMNEFARAGGRALLGLT